MKAIAKRLERSRVLLALAGLSATVVVAFGDAAQIMRQVTGDSHLKDGAAEIGDLVATADRLSNWAVTITVIAAPIALGGCALALAFGGSKRLVAPMYATVGAVMVSVLAKAVAG